MESKSLSAGAAGYKEKQKFEDFEQILEQKKILFKKLRSDLENLALEIEKLSKEQESMVTANVKKSLEDCVYHQGEKTTSS